MMTHPQMMNGCHDVVPPPPEMMTHHCPLSMGDKCVSCFNTGKSMYMIHELQNYNESSDDEWAS